MSFSLPDTMRAHIDGRVESGTYGNTSEYLRELIRHDLLEQTKKQFRELIGDGLKSGPGRVFTHEVEMELRERALGRTV